MSDLRQGHAIFRHGDLIAVDALDLEPVGRSCHYEPEVANLRLTGRWPVDLVEDAVTQRDPYPAGAERGHHSRRPGWPGARTSRCDRGSHSSPAPCRNNLTEGFSRMPSPLLVRISPAQSEQWYRWIGRRRIISASAEHRGNACQRKHPAENPGTSRPLQPIRKDLVIRFRRQRLAREAIMAAKEISVKKYVVRLSGEERERLETLIRKGKSPARRVLKARILLKADVSEAGKGW